MIVLDEPYVSQPLLEWLEASGHPVLDNAVARTAGQGRALNYVPDVEARRRLDAGERVCTNSENALGWILENTHNENLTRAVALFKDKARMREILRDLDPDLFFRRCDAVSLASLDFEADFEDAPKPFVLKPSIGFGSMGVYVINDRAEWDAALADIDRNAKVWRGRYPESVVGIREFVLEGYLGGTEYALDAFFDEAGKARMLNVFRHDFASSEDTSDRMYVTSANIVRETAPLFEAWLNRVNERVGARNFPVHVEVRVDAGHVSPIEFNPLRFAGLGSTDLSLFAYGFRTYEAFLENKMPNFDEAFADKDGKVYSMSLLNPPADADLSAPFDYDALCARFSHVLEMRRFDVKRFGAYGFLFLEVDERNERHAEELEYLKTTDLREFIG